MAVDFSLSYCHPFLFLIYSTFVALLLLLHVTFTALYMVSISPLIPVKTVFKSLVSCSEFIIIFKQFYSHSSLAGGWDHSSLKLSAYIYIFVDLIHSRLGQLENQHGYAEMEVMGLNVTEFRHAIVADCCFSVENRRSLWQRLWNLWQHVVDRDSGRLRAGLYKPHGLASVLIIASTGSYFHLMLVGYLTYGVPHTKLALQ